MSNNQIWTEPPTSGPNHLLLPAGPQAGWMCWPTRSATSRPRRRHGASPLSPCLYPFEVIRATRREGSPHLLHRLFGLDSQAPAGRTVRAVLTIGMPFSAPFQCLFCSAFVAVLPPCADVQCVCCVSAVSCVSSVCVCVSSVCASVCVCLSAVCVGVSMTYSPRWCVYDILAPLVCL